MSRRRVPLLAVHVPALLFALLLAVFFAIHHAEDRLGYPARSSSWGLGGLLFWIVLAALVSYLAWLLVRGAVLDRRSARFAAAREQQVLDGVPDALLVVNADGRIERANVALLEIAGISPVLGVGTALADVPLIAEDGRAMDWPADGHARARLGSPSSAIDVDVSARPLPGHPDLRLVHIHDVSRELADLRRITRQQEELRILADLGRELNRVTTESELLELAIEHISRRISVARAGGIFIADQAAGVLRLSCSYGLDPAFVAAERVVPLGECLCGQVALTGEPRFSASSAGDLFHTRHRDESPHGHFVLPLAAEAGVFGVMFLYLHEDAEIDLDWQRLLEGVANEVSLALMRVRAHTALSESERRLERLFEEAPDAMLVANPGGVVLRVNRRARRWFVAGESVSQRLPWTALLARAEAGDGPHRVRLDSNQGRESVLEIMASAAAAGEVQLILRDLTREVVLERKTHELQKMQVVGALSAGLAHNLNNIFASVLAHLCQLREIAADSTGIDLAVRGGDLEFARRHLATAIAGAEEVSVLIERLLEFARPRDAHVETLDLGRVLREQVELARPILGPMVDVELDLPPTVAAMADRSIVVNALMNLLLNAAEAMSRRGKLIVRMGAPEGDGDVWFAVQDSGVGMDEATRARLFEPFFTTKSAGTGLGLSTLHAGITSLGGRVDIQSVPGEGSTFTIHLPRVAWLNGTQQRATPPQTRRVLLAEDVPTLRRFTARHLEARGWEVRTVGTVAELVSVATEWSPGTVVVDWNLADGNVADCIEHLRDLGSEVIILTGDPGGVRVKDVPVLRKPVDWDRLDELLCDPPSRCSSRTLES